MDLKGGPESPSLSGLADDLAERLRAKGVYVLSKNSRRTYWPGGRTNFG